jgi:hypothetical protein
MNTRFSAALLTVSATIALPMLAALPAAAVTVTIGTISYDVTLFTGSYNNNTSLFQALSPGKMPWWGDSTGDSASEFATQVYDQLGNGPTSGYGPVFAYDFDSAGVIGLSQNLTNPLVQTGEFIALDTSVAYAIATPLGPPPSSVPAPLPVFGAMAAFGCSRRIRKRICEVRASSECRLNIG